MTNRNKIETSHYEQGSAIVYVFIGIILFAALMFTFSRISQNGNSNMSNKRAAVIASEMLGYSNDVQKSVDALLLKGCSESQLSFENNSEAGYTNAAAPADKSCHLFNSAGGHMSYQYPPTGAETIRTAAAHPGYHNYAFTGNMKISSLGTTLPELIIWTQTNKEVCDQINSQLGQTTADEIFADGVIGGLFTGSFATAGPETIGDDAYPPELPAGCFNRPVYPGQYIFYKVLITR